MRWLKRMWRGVLSAKDRHHLHRMVIVILILAGSGVGCLLLGNLSRYDFFNRIGAALIAGAVTGLFLKVVFYEAESSRITMEASDRREVMPQHSARMYSATQIDVLSMSAHGTLKQLYEEIDGALIRGWLKKNAQVRILFVTPEANIVAVRARADSRPAEHLKDMLRESATKCAAIGLRIKNHMRGTAGGKSPGTCSYEGRLTEECPHIWLFRTDGDLRWGPYTADANTIPSPSFSIKQDIHAELFITLTKHFETLWSRAIGSNSAVAGRIVMCDGSFDSVEINRDLLQRIGAPIPEEGEAVVGAG